MIGRQTPFLSIIVPVYNSERYLTECIESILHQCYKDYELILVDDGSIDSSLRICQNYKYKDDRIRVLSQKNKGSTAARKNGLSIALGYYIGFIDSDDWIHSHMFGEMCQMAKEYDADIVMCDMVSVYKNAKIDITQEISEGYYDKKRLCQEVYPTMLCDRINYSFYKVFPAFWNKIFKKEIITSCLRQIDERVKLGDDLVCIYPCLLKANKIYYLKNRYLYYYRQRDNSLSREYNSQYLKNLGIIVENLKKNINYSNFACQMAGYVCHKVEDAIEEGLALGFDRELKDMLRKDYTNAELQSLVDMFDKSYLSYFQKLKLFLLNKEKYGVLFMLCKMKQLFKRNFQYLSYKRNYEFYE